MQNFNPSEIFQFAITIEENGEKFYRDKARIVSSQKVKDLFLLLADEEIDHKNTFNNLLSNIEKYESVESYPDQYFDYLKAYVDDRIFKEDKIQKEAEGINNEKDALDFAFQRELDSILYYQEIKKFVLKENGDLINKIIDEERKHVLKLSNMRKEL